MCRAVDAGEEVEECGVDLGGTFLLCPVSAARQYHRAVQLRRDSTQRVARPTLATQHFTQRGAPVRATQGGDHVAVSHHVQRGDVDPAPRKGASSSLLRSMLRYQLKAPVNAC